MAAYAALISLTNLTEDMQNHPQLSTSLVKIQIQSLKPTLRFLLYFIETYGSRRRAKDLERQIAAAAQNAEDVIESHIVDRILDGQASSSFLFNVQRNIRNMMEKFPKKKQSEDDDNSRLDTVIKEMDSIVVKIREIEKSLQVLSQPEEYGAFKKSTTLVGFNQEIDFLLSKLTSDSLPLQIIRVVGMGGIGKTTLARYAFDDPLIVHRFDFRVWVKISVKYSMRKVYHQLLSGEVEPHESDIELAERLHKKLYGRRYLIVLDDVWDCHILNEMRLRLPDNGNGSRIVITTRINQQEFSDSWTSFVKLLDDESSWKLFCERVFGGDYCPLHELEYIGKWIVEQCKGLPLSIVVIGGHLSKSPMTWEYWKYVCDNVNSILSSGEDGRCLNILSLSYNHLPAHLKPCFLYTGFFPEDGEILVSKLIQLWVAEGFIEPSFATSKTLEEIAESFLEDLVDRNLIIVDRRGQCGNIVACKIHDLLRDLCITMAERENFLRVWRLRQSPSLLGGERRVAIHGGTMDHVDHRELFDALKSAPLVRSLIFDAGVDDLPSDLKLLKVLSVIEDGTDVRRLQLLQSVSKFHQQYVNLKYLHDGLLPLNHSLGCILKLPSSISHLWNLQTLILGWSFHAPPEIWEMLSLRHLICNRILLPDPPSTGKQKRTILQNLQTLSEAEDFRLSEEVCARIPNIKNLRMFNGYLNELQSLTKLESLTCEFSSEEPVISDFPRLLEFPSSLVELCLIKCYLGWEDLSAIGSLPCLLVLKLGYTIKGNDWNPIEGEFKKLKHLEIWGWDDLINWNAEWSHFPVLISLTLKGLTELSEIPLDIGYIPTLESIKLDECSVSAAISAVRIVEEQRSCGNEDLQLQVCFRNQENSRMFAEMVEEEGRFEHQSSSSRNDKAVFKFKC